MTWNRFKEHLYQDAALGIALDISRVPFPDDYLGSMEARIQQAFAAMAALEKGAIANPSEKRMVGHYWLRAPGLAPTKELTQEIVSTVASIKKFASKVHSGGVTGPKGKFTHLLVIGIGGSALGPQFVSHALGTPRRRPDGGPISSTTPTPTGSTSVLAELGAQPRADAGGRDLQVGRHRRDPQRPARRGRGVQGRRAVPPGALRRRDRRRLEAGRARQEGGVARPLPHVGLGRRAARASSAPSGSCRPRSRASTSTRCSRGRPPWTR